MGATFSNIHVRKNNTISSEQITEILRRMLLEMKYTETADKDDHDIKLAVYAPDNSDYISAACEAVDFKVAEDMQSTALSISEKVGSDVITAACVDSDFMMICYENAKKGADGWINIGKPYSKKLPRRTALAAWKKICADKTRLKEIVSEDRIFAEEAFFELGKMIGLDETACCLDSNSEGEYIKTLYFKTPPSAEIELPKFKIWLFSGNPCDIDTENCVHAVNQGGRGKGIAVIISGNFVKDDSLVFEDPIFECDTLSKRRKTVPITFVKKESKDGGKFLYWEDSSFNIPQKVDPSLPDIKQLDLEGKRAFGIRFTLRGDPDQRFFVKVFFIPLQNYQNGSDCWYYDRYSKI